MKNRILLAALLMLAATGAAIAQSVPPTKWIELDGSPSLNPPRTVIVPNGSISGNTVTLTGGGGSGTVTSIATTGPISGGTITTTGTISCPTCTTNAAALTSNAVVLGGGSQAAKVVTGITTDGASVLTLGVAGASVGGVTFNNATSGSITVQPVTGALGTVTLSLPATTSTLACLACAQTFSAAQAFSSTIAQSSTSATAFASGASSATPSFLIDNSTASQASGISVIGKADGTAPEIKAISRTQITTALAGNGLSITADPAIAGSSVAGAAAGGSVTITAGNAARNTSGNANGGNISLIPGSGIGTGVQGWINIGGTTSSTPGIGWTTTGFFGQPGIASIDGGGSTLRYVGANNFVSSNLLSNISSTVNMRLGGNLEMVSGFQLLWTSNSTNAVNTADLIVRRGAAANIAFGAADAASPVAQTFSVQNVVAGTSNTAGANWTHAASRGTGTGVGGDIIFQTAPAGSSGTSQNTLATAFTIKGDGSTQFKSVTFANLPTQADGKMIFCSDCTIASPCASGGTGAFAKGINSQWVCN